MSSRTKVRLLIVDDHPVVREGLRSMMSNFRQIAVVAICATGEEALRIISENVIDVALIDLRMTGLGGIDLLRRIRQQQPSIRCVILSSYEREEEVHQAVEAGAVGYLSKDAFPTNILEGVLAVHAGQQAFPPHLRQCLELRRQRKELTTRELDVLKLLAKGLTNKEIAQVLGLSQFTVRNQLASITRKLEVSDRTEAVSVAIELGILLI